MEVAELFASVAGLRLPVAAARFAAAGVPVFPCVPGGKSPLTTRGYREATTNGRRVYGWWRWQPTANIGVPTGAVTGVEVVDVDRKAAGSGFAAFERARRAGLVPEWLGLVRTPSGGLHAYFPSDPDRPQRSWEAAGPHLDFRGDGGYIVVPPSVVEVTADLRAGYELIAGAQPHPAPVDAMALRDFLDPRPEPVFPRGETTRVVDAERLARWVAVRAEGERNRGLFWAACRLAEAGAAPAVTLGVLGPAAERAGLPPREVFTTIRSAYRTTAAAPARPSAGAPAPGEAPRRTVRVGSQVLL
jgi:hypothetical protein